MAFNYFKDAEDKQYREVSLMADAYGPWKPFAGDTVQYPEQCVLEVEREDGSVHIEYEQGARTIPVGRNGNLLFFPEEIPVARMWIRGKGKTMYKVPAELQEMDGRLYMLIPGGLQDISICGDDYFNKVYHLTIG